VSETANRIEDEALRLSVNQRARLARRLLESLDEEEVEDPEEVARAWEAEVARRVSQYEAGEAGALTPAAEVVREARERLRNQP
jgi:putative addiction module component (TIGR02574 family)